LEKKKIAQAMSEKLEYICLDLEQIPETLKYVENINFKPNIGIEENKYRQYRFYILNGYVYYEIEKILNK